MGGRGQLADRAPLVAGNPCASQVLLLPFRDSIKELSLKMKAACCWGGSGTSLLCSQSSHEVFPLLLLSPNFWSRDQGDSYNFTIFIYNFLTTICLGGRAVGGWGEAASAPKWCFSREWIYFQIRSCYGTLVEMAEMKQCALGSSSAFVRHCRYSRSGWSLWSFLGSWASLAAQNWNYRREGVWEGGWWFH